MQFLMNSRDIILLFLFCIFSIAVFLGKDLRNCFHLLMVALNITDRSDYEHVEGFRNNFLLEVMGPLNPLVCKYKLFSNLS